jgi:hypothetical protein
MHDDRLMRGAMLSSDRHVDCLASFTIHSRLHGHNPISLATVS